MQMIPVASSNIAAVGYDIIQQMLFIKFHSGQEYKYQGVPVESYEEMKASTSIGSYYHKNIKNKFNGTKNEGEQSGC